MGVNSKAVPNLIQGVSQQSPQQRRDTQCEEQFDCVNSPVDGCVARPPTEVIKFLTGQNFTGAFCYDIFRADTEHYLVVIKGGTLRAFDLADGTECTITFPDGTGYLAASGSPKNVFRAATVDDFTFLVNREVVPAQVGTISPTVASFDQGMFYFRAGAYSTTYTLRITMLGTQYNFSYTTPDNSVPGNAAFIATNQLCASLFSAMFGALPGGFGAERRGNVARMWRVDGIPWSLDSDDGQGDTHLHTIKGFVQRFDDLPQAAFNDFKVKVQGQKRDATDDYYVTFQGLGTSDSVWEEDIGWATHRGLNAATMPWQLVNTNYRTFVFEKAPWGERVAGDETTCKDPSFVGKPIQDIFWDNPRLAVLTEGSAVWSKARNPYFFYPDTVQTVLAEAPVDINISAARTVALLRKAVIAQDNLTLWAQKAQFRVGTASNQVFKQDTVEAKQNAAYEFVEAADACPVATSLYFSTNTGKFTTIRDLLFDQGKLIGDTDITQHTPQYVPTGVRQIVASDTLNMMAVTTEGDPSALYIYNWFLTNQERAQSAWNKWRLPSDCTILWVGIHTTTLKLAVQRTDGVMFLSVNLAPRYTDAEGTYLTRLDLRINDAATTHTYDSTLNQTTITVPFNLPEAVGDLTKLLVVVRQDLAVFGGGGAPTLVASRGDELPIVSISGHNIVVAGNHTATSFYLGLRISAERLESEFYVRSESGAEPANRVQVMEMRMVHSNTGPYRAEVTYTNGQTGLYATEGRVLGDPSNMLDKIVLANGILRVPIGADNTGYKVRFINDSFLPSQWQSSEYHYQVDIRARPSPTQGKSQ